jgi:hypothetical protein
MLYYSRCSPGVYGSVLARPAQPNNRLCRLSTRAKAQKLCKDVISVPTREFQGSGKTYKVTLMSQGESKTIECADDTYILDAADANGIDLPATCRGTF